MGWDKNSVVSASVNTLYELFSDFSSPELRYSGRYFSYVLKYLPHHIPSHSNPSSGHSFWVNINLPPMVIYLFVLPGLTMTRWILWLYACFVKILFYLLKLHSSLPNTVQWSLLINVLIIFQGCIWFDLLWINLCW